MTCVAPGRIKITANSATTMVESLFALAMIMQNDCDRWQQIIKVPRQPSPKTRS